eukprot:scaffold15108_cov180-Amphora_coffeaeformis.AAC.53
MFDFEVVGLQSSSNGRSCSIHECCGEDVMVGDVLRLVACTVAVQGVVEEAIKAVKVVEGIDQCTVGFVPRAFKDLPAVKNQLNKFVQVCEVYKDSPNGYKRDKSYKNCGMARVTTLDEEGQNE